MFLTVTQVADRLSVHHVTVRRWIKAGQLHAVRLGDKSIRVHVDDLDSFIDDYQTAVAS